MAKTTASHKTYQRWSVCGMFEVIRGKMIKTIEITEEDLTILDCMLTVASKKQTIRNANFFEKDTGKHFNACFKYEDFMFEKFGIFLTDNHLSDKNKDILKKAEENTRLKEKQEQGTLF